MERIVLALVGLILLLTACATIDEASTPPSANDVDTAKEYMEDTSPDDTKNYGDDWSRAVVIKTHYKSEGGVKDWSMLAVLPDGKTRQFIDSPMAVEADLHGLISAGDYVALKDDGDQYLREDEIKVITPGVIQITGK